MLWNLDPTWLLLAFAVVSILSFILALGLDAIMAHEGFGPIGNMIVITSGFFLGIFTANSYGISMDDLTMASVTGVGGSFGSLFVLAALKGALNRLL